VGSQVIADATTRWAREATCGRRDVTHYDVGVIGLGAMGSAALFHLARRGVKAVGIERFMPGHDRGSSHGESRAIRLAYSEHPSYVPLVRAAFEGWYELESLTGETVLTTTGILEAGKPSSRMVAGSLEACHVHKLDHEIFDAAEVNSRFPAMRLPNGYHAVWQPEGGFIRPELADRLHRDLARGLGAKIVAGTRVTAIEPTDTMVRIWTGDEEIEVGSVVVTAGPWIADLVPVLRPRLTIGRMVMTWYDPMRPDYFAPDRLPVFMIEGEDDLVYGFPDSFGNGFKCASHYPSGTLAHADLAKQDAGSADEVKIRRFLLKYMPAGAGRLRAMKTCMYTMTKDEDFVIDSLPEDQRVVICSACSGHGYKFASALGEVLADLATTGETRHDISRFSMSRFR
jgi:sarcosine oxidase